VSNPTPRAEALEALDEHGFFIVPDVLDRQACAKVRSHLVAAAQESERRGAPTYIPTLDPNAANVRVFNLLDLHRTFRELIVDPLALEIVRGLLGDGFIISNFTANIAKPGSRSMTWHADQSIVIPEPWLEPWAINIIWCLDDVHPDNGATRYLPGSHRVTRRAELPADMNAEMRCFEAPAGAIIAMDGRVWHTSGCNVTADQERALLFGFYTRDFIRPQVNWNALLSEQTKAQIEPPLYDWLGLGPAANVYYGSSYTVLGEHA
jgi:ectoine hydroxylase-related dioxygenase (phytanoyl-CoA dioxygenase family)